MSTEDLNEPIEVNRNTIELTPDGQLNKEEDLYNLGWALRYSLHQTGEVDSTIQWIALYQKLINKQPENSTWVMVVSEI